MPHKKGPEAYRQLADKCRETARAVLTEKERADLLVMAQTWDVIADRLGRAARCGERETSQDSPNAQFHIQQPSEKLLARNQQRPDLLRSNRFGVHRLEPSHPQQLGKPTRILAVCLNRHRRKCRLHMPCLQQNGFKSCLREPGMQPL